MWFRIDDGFYSHPKVYAASPAALGLWVVAGSWSAASGTGGMVPAHALGRLLPGAEALADELVVAGLWETDGPAGYRFHDWTDYNPSAEEARTARDKQASAGKLGNHRRWHLSRGVVDPKCVWCGPDRPVEPGHYPDRVPDRSPDRGSDRGGDSPRRAPDAAPAHAGGHAPIGSDRVTTPKTIGSTPNAGDDQHVSEAGPDRVPDGGSESGGNPPSRPVPSRPGTYTSTSVGGVGEGDAGASSTATEDMLPAVFTDPITTPAPTKQKADPRGHRLPDDFQVTDAMSAWAAEKAPGVGWDEHEAFVDYWRAQPGARGRKTDWVATWRNWMRRASTGPTGSPRRATPARQTTTDRVGGWLTLGGVTPDPTPPTPTPAALGAADNHQEVIQWHA